MNDSNDPAESGYFRNWVSIAGVGLMLVSLFGGGLVTALELLAGRALPYAGHPLPPVHGGHRDRIPSDPAGSTHRAIGAASAVAEPAHSRSSASIFEIGSTASGRWPFSSARSSL